MITTPDRISEAVAAMGRGEQVDWRKLADLQALDMAQIGRQFVEEAIRREEAEIDAIEQALKGNP